VNLAARELLHGNQHFVEEVLHRLQGGAPRALVEAIRRVPWEQEGDLADQGGWGRRLRGPLRGNRLLVRDAPPSLEEALIFLAEAGGDTDTNAAVAGALLGARDGEASIRPAGWISSAPARGVSALAERLVRAG